MAEKKKILLLSDDLRMSSGIATVSKELVTGTIDKYHWVQLGAAVNHPEKGKEIDLGEDMRKLTGVEDASVLIYPFLKLQILIPEKLDFSCNTVASITACFPPTR